ncbi:MAG: hypothetical protein AAB345_00630 [Patescibacteria group bacterium]
MGMEGSSTNDAGKSEESSVPKIEAKKGWIKLWLQSNSLLITALGGSLIVGALITWSAIHHVKKDAVVKEKIKVAVEAAHQKSIIRLEEWSQLSKYRDHEFKDVLPGPNGDSVIVVFDDCDYSQEGVERLETAFLNSNLFKIGERFTDGGLALWAPNQRILLNKQLADREAAEKENLAIAELKNGPVMTFMELLNYDGCSLNYVDVGTGVCGIVLPNKKTRFIKMDLLWTKICQDGSNFKIDCEKIFAAVRAEARKEELSAARRQLLEKEAKELDSRPLEK